MTFKLLHATDSDFKNVINAQRTSQKTDRIIQKVVTQMVDAIEATGDVALLDYTARFDHYHAESINELCVPQARLDKALNSLNKVLRQDLEIAAERLKDFHQNQQTADWSMTDKYGMIVGERVKPLSRAVIYAPGGKAAYPSSVLMGVIPAVIAGVDDIILTTPAPQGKVNEVTLAAAAIAGAKQVYLLGGAQAIIGFALGTDTLPRADIIAGPGNAYVAEAKRQMFGQVAIDSIAGPSEVLILSDKSAPVDWVCADLMAQAEHDEQAQCIFITTDAEHARQVIQTLAEKMKIEKRQSIIRESLEQHGIFILASSTQNACDIANTLAVEHVQVMTENAEEVAAQINNAGSLFIGNHSCVPLGDYVAGPNHVLPTATTARFSSPLSVRHFVKHTGIICANAQSAKALAPTVANLARAEGLFAHANAVEKRHE